MSHPFSTADEEMTILTKELCRLQPKDVVQFCANHFLARLEAQRAEITSHLAIPSAIAASHMASSFPGSNPFGGREKSMQSIGEDEEQHHSTPSVPQNSTSANHNAAASTHVFGTSGFNPGGQDSGPPTDGYNFSRRTSVSAESMNPSEPNSENWTPPVHPKSDDQKARLRQAVSPNFLFSHLHDDQTVLVLNALQEKPIPAKGIKVINQGEAGDYFYVVEKGGFDVFVNPAGYLQPGLEGMGKKVASITSGGSFGELALMYNAPRAATVISTEPSTLWALDRVTFRRILMDSAFQRRQMYESFLAEVKLLEPLTGYERSKIADALHTEKYPPGQTIIKEGDPGEAFFLIEEGEAEVFRNDHQGPVNHLKKGDYFGELALLDNKPRAASVISKTELKLAMLGQEGFQRLLGPVESMMRRNDPSRREPESVDPLTKTT